MALVTASLCSIPAMILAFNLKKIFGGDRDEDMDPDYELESESDEEEYHDHERRDNVNLRSGKPPSSKPPPKKESLTKILPYDDPGARYMTLPRETKEHPWDMQNPSDYAVMGKGKQFFSNFDDSRLWQRDMLNDRKVYNGKIKTMMGEFHTFSDAPPEPTGTYAHEKGNRTLLMKNGITNFTNKRRKEQCTWQPNTDVDTSLLTGYKGQHDTRRTQLRIANEGIRNNMNSFRPDGCSTGIWDNKPVGVAGPGHHQMMRIEPHMTPTNRQFYQQIVPRNVDMPRDYDRYNEMRPTVSQVDRTREIPLASRKFAHNSGPNLRSRSANLSSNRSQINTYRAPSVAQNVTDTRTQAQHRDPRRTETQHVQKPGRLTEATRLRLQAVGGYDQSNVRPEIVPSSNKTQGFGTLPGVQPQMNNTGPSRSQLDRNRDKSMMARSVGNEFGVQSSYMTPNIVQSKRNDAHNTTYTQMNVGNEQGRTEPTIIKSKKNGAMQLDHSQIEVGVSLSSINQFKVVTTRKSENPGAVYVQPEYERNQNVGTIRDQHAPKSRVGSEMMTQVTSMQADGKGMVRDHHAPKPKTNPDGISMPLLASRNNENTAGQIRAESTKFNNSSGLDTIRQVGGDYTTATGISTSHGGTSHNPLVAGKTEYRGNEEMSYTNLNIDPRNTNMNRINMVHRESNLVEQTNNFQNRADRNIQSMARPRQAFSSKSVETSS